MAICEMHHFQVFYLYEGPTVSIRVQVLEQNVIVGIELLLQALVHVLNKPLPIFVEHKAVIVDAEDLMNPQPLHYRCVGKTCRRRQQNTLRERRLEIPKLQIRQLSPERLWQSHED